MKKYALKFWLSFWKLESQAEGISVHSARFPGEDRTCLGTKSWPVKWQELRSFLSLNIYAQDSSGHLPAL